MRGVSECLSERGVSESECLSERGVSERCEREGVSERLLERCEWVSK